MVGWACFKGYDTGMDMCGMYVKMAASAHARTAPRRATPRKSKSSGMSQTPHLKLKAKACLRRQRHSPHTDCTYVYSSPIVFLCGDKRV